MVRFMADFKADVGLLCRVSVGPNPSLRWTHCTVRLRKPALHKQIKLRNRSSGEPTYYFSSGVVDLQSTAGGLTGCVCLVRRVGILGAPVFGRFFRRDRGG